MSWQPDGRQFIDLYICRQRYALKAVEQLMQREEARHVR